MKIQFKCPKCGGTRLECIMNGIHSCPVTEIDDSGDFEYGDYESQADVERWQCLTCADVIQDENKHNIIHNEEVAEWCQANCEQGESDEVS